jgi:membrane protein implicated in regulation of membrane protease activity
MLWMMLVMVFPILGLFLFAFLPWSTALPVYLVGTALSGVLHLVMMRSQKLPVRTGRQGMVGRTAEVVAWDGASGRVRCHDELWRAVTENSERPVPGRSVTVTGVEGLTLVVRSGDGGADRGARPAAPPHAPVAGICARRPQSRRSKRA